MAQPPAQTTSTDSPEISHQFLKMNKSGKYPNPTTYEEKLLVDYYINVCIGEIPVILRNLIEGLAKSKSIEEAQKYWITYNIQAYSTEEAYLHFVPKEERDPNWSTTIWPTTPLQVTEAIKTL